jgi:hypothetical protein
MYDGLTARYTFACPSGSRPSVRLSSFRALEQLPGTARPAVYQVRFACPCGADHPALVTHDQLDWEPIGAAAAPFYDVMTGRVESAAAELAEEAAHRIRLGRWPWAFYCFAEGRARPIFPSFFRLLAPQRDRIVVAARCPSCATTSVNVVSHEHLDLPYWSDPAVDVLDRIFDCHDDENLAELAEELEAGPYPATRRHLDPGHSRQG